ncbi:hypothetical protein HMPREF1981_02050 [Bacteroides pyogenes F0041]|uniref:Phage tail component protein n=1 Tax=Bacteroides pyogenes F0041 TaxID=1321819 RepID=U2CM72_9BACE|nr:hypothetical protein [Bacteroides pyogenes]ERI85163.1 hypothetical protein HMPREF1981_02050 [Bacteroides pyogenes F0041]MBB3894402.1 hypothetical protein [Bacteroides pyogenes]GAE21235.1 hypothetical protein JCM10003_655 [Bacteroides pyogenes JCM 10003]SUV35501.1 Uncharacterised protein [Bacteroides pyogenes]
MEGEWKINGKDMYTEYGMYLTEKNQGDYFNLSELLKPSKMKPYTAVSFREENGEKLPDTLPGPKREPRDFQLYAAIVADTPERFSANFTAVMQLLSSGWLTLETSLTGRTYRVYYQECTAYEPLTGTEDGEVVCRMKLKFREPNPQL